MIPSMDCPPRSVVMDRMAPSMPRSSPRGDALPQLVEPGLDLSPEQAEVGSCCRRIVLRDRPEMIEPLLDESGRRLESLDIGLVPGQQIAALRRLGILDRGEQLVERRRGPRGCGSPTGHCR